MGACFHIDGVTCDNCRPYKQDLRYYREPAVTTSIEVSIPSLEQRVSMLEYELAGLKLRLSEIEAKKQKRKPAARGRR